MPLTIEQLLKKIDDYSESDQALVKRAYVFAEETHRNQRRVSGAPYVMHPLGTAMNIADMHMPARIIAAALLHDVLEDTTLPREQVYQDLKKTFDEDIAKLVERVTKLSRVQYHGMRRYLENLRKMFIAMAEDLRVVILKFADRLNNLQDLEVLPEHKRTRVAIETLEVYAPIAHRLGMGEIKGNLEDLAFPHAYPKEHARLHELVKGKFEEKEERLKKVRTIIESELKRNQIPYLSIHGRTKHLYSLYKKLQKYNGDLSKVYDLVALRIIVAEIADCYTILGIIHNRFKPLKGRIKDYIAQPKPNGYQSLHTTVFTDDGEIIEFQIRTKEMHEEAEYGIAAHWRYEEHDKKAPPSARQIHWMKELAKIQKALQDHRSFLETLEELKIDVFQNRIFVFTPNGDVLDLPENSTPIDFAYAIHTELGNHCTGTRVNGELAALDTKLTSGDVVDIITDSKRRSPSTDWLKFAKTRNARTKIKAATRNKVADWLRMIIPHKTEPKKKKTK